ncbi:MAG: CBS domain-containing protein [Arenicella sp.]
MVNKTVRSIMRSTNICLNPKMSLDLVSDHLTENHLPGAPVIDENHNPIGFVSEYDCLKQLMQSTYYCDNTALAEDVMSTKLITTSPELALIDVASQMNDNKVNVAPVVEEGKIIGVISRGDVMRELVKDLLECKVPV